MPKSIREIQYSSAQRYMVTSRICYTTSNSTEIGANRNNSRERKWIDMHVLIRLAHTHAHINTHFMLLSVMILQIFLFTHIVRTIWPYELIVVRVNIRYTITIVAIASDSLYYCAFHHYHSHHRRH